MTGRGADSLREELERLDGAGELKRIGREVDPCFELAAVARRLDDGPALLFESVRGHDMPVAIGTLSRRSYIALSLGRKENELAAVYERALAEPLAPQPVDPGGAPVKQVVEPVRDLREQLPVLTHFEGDAGPYITSGVTIAEDPDRGIRNLSYHRMNVVGPEEVHMVIVRRHLYRLQEAAEERGEPLPVAVVLGLEAATRLAAGTSGSAVPFGFDELGLAGALVGSPIDVVQCETSRVMVPAKAEIVIEGEILPGERVEEGPFAEFDGSYEREVGHLFRPRVITRRVDAIYQGLISGSAEQLEIMGFSNEPSILKAIRGGLPGARAINVTQGGLRKFHVILSIDVEHPGDGKDAILAVFAAHRDVKLVVVVDGDVDPFDLTEVERAIATRFQADQDLVVVSGGRANRVDPSCTELGETARMGLDATVSRRRSGGKRSDRAKIPGLEELDLDAYL